MLLYSTPKQVIAEIWAYYPEYTIENLYNKINTWGSESNFSRNADFSAAIIMGNISKFCSIICLVNLFIQKPKFQTYIKTGVMFFICLLVVIFSFYLSFMIHADELEQKAYYVVQQVEVDQSFTHIEQCDFDLAYEKVETELRSVEKDSLIDNFRISFRIPKIINID